jgi:membrane-associated phospholipid phosphatase
MTSPTTEAVQPGSYPEGIWNGLRADALRLLRNACHNLGRAWFLVLVSALLIAGFSIALFPRDRLILGQIQGAASEAWMLNLARNLSYWGDYFPGTILVTALVWGLGAWRRNRYWQRAALACLLAASCAGLLNNTLRYTVGRPRPMASMPDGINGPSAEYKMQSFPSGHSATAMGTAAALLVAAPPVGIPVLICACGVVWSRLELDCHYPSDVLVGSYFGLVFGLVFGFAARQMREKKITETYFRQ